MSIDRLANEGKIHPFKATREEITRVLSLAERDLVEAEKISGESLDWSYSIAYNSVLQACRAFMYYHGYRPASFEAHKATFEFMELSIEESMRATVDYFNRVRKKRHRVIYDEVGLVTEKEAQYLIARATEFLEYVRNILKPVLQ